MDEVEGEHADVDYYDYQHEDGDELVRDAGRRPKKQAVPLHRTQSLPYTDMASSLLDGDRLEGTVHQEQHQHQRTQSLDKDALLDAPTSCCTS